MQKGCWKVNEDDEGNMEKNEKYTFFRTNFNI